MNRSVSAGVLIGAIVAAGGVIAGQRFIAESAPPATSCQAAPEAALAADGARTVQRLLDEAGGESASDQPAFRETPQNDRYGSVANACGAAIQ